MKNIIVGILLLSFPLLMACNTNTEKPQAVVDSTALQPEIPTHIEFPSLDGLSVMANLYYDKKNSGAPILLCHMAEFNKSEYRTIAKKLCEMGYNCMAIDQRSGGNTSGYENETRIEADKKGKPVSFLDAEQDITAAIGFLSKRYNSKVILWGSSYSASLALKIGKRDSRVSAVLAFSPGEYFKKDSLELKSCIRNIGKPVFVTSSRDEANDELIKIIEALGPANVTHFRPKGRGEHGSPVLWDDCPDNTEYWKAVTQFLSTLPKEQPL
jgi:dienelactone hydrolase